MDGDLTNRLRLTTFVTLDGYYHRDFDIDWSPDGRRIAFAGEKDDVNGIFVVAFVGETGGNFDLYLMRSDGTDRVRVTSTPGDELAPAWSPE